MWNWIGKLAELNADGRPVAVVTVARHEGSVPREAGSKMLVLPDGTIFGTIGGGHLEQLAIEDAQKCLQESTSCLIRYPLAAKAGQCCGGQVELLFETVNTGPHVYIFGAGHVGQAVCHVLSGTPFTVHLIDERDRWVNSGGLPKGIIQHACPWDEFIESAKWDAKNTFVCIMTHRHDQDQDILENVITKPNRYLGVIGSDNKWARFKERLRNKGIPETSLARVRCPLGITIGGKAPQEIAISLAAELLKTFYQSYD